MGCILYLLAVITLFDYGNFETTKVTSRYAIWGVGGGGDLFCMSRFKHDEYFRCFNERSVICLVPPSECFSHDNRLHNTSVEWREKK